MDENSKRSSRVEALNKAGISIPARDYSLQKMAQLKETTEAMIDDFMRMVGVKDPQAQTDENGWRTFQCGSALGRAGIISSDKDLYLRSNPL